jgi:V/A-type H+-transporting ATPase subunit D
LSNQIVPTKGNLLATKKSLELSRTGFELLDRKRNILIREMMTLIDRASEIQKKIDTAYSEAYEALQRANITLGICKELSKTVPVEDGLNVAYRSVMGVEIPMVSFESHDVPIPFGLQSTNSLLDLAYNKFGEVKKMTAELAEIENSVYRLADAVKKTQKRANALKNIMIPRFESTVKLITDALEEKDREEFSRLKVIKRQKLSAS